MNADPVSKFSSLVIRNNYQKKRTNIVGDEVKFSVKFTVIFSYVSRLDKLRILLYNTMKIMQGTYQINSLWIKS